MPRTLSVLLAGWLAVAAGPVAADDAAKAVIDRAIQAAGGAATLAKFAASVAKVKGTVHEMGLDIAFAGTISSQGADRLRSELEIAVAGDKFTVINVLNRDKAWEKLDGEVEEMDKEQLAELREEAHLGWVTTLVPLRDKAFTLAPLGERIVGDRPAVGVKVSHKERRDVNLYFDKETALLVLTESRVLDEDSGQEVTEATYYSDYKDVQGMKTPMKLKTLRDGKPYIDAEVTEIKYHEKLDDAVFGRP